MNYLLALLIGAALGGAGLWKATSLHYEHKIDLAAREARQLVDDADQRAVNAESDWTVWAALQRPKTITLTREVDREIQADTDCSAHNLPDELRDALTRVGAAADQPVVAGAVPAAPAAPAHNFWGRTARLLGGPGRAEGVRGEQDGPR